MAFDPLTARERTLALLSDAGEDGVLLEFLPVQIVKSLLSSGEATLRDGVVYGAYQRYPR